MRTFIKYKITNEGNNKTEPVASQHTNLSWNKTFKVMYDLC